MTEELTTDTRNEIDEVDFNDIRIEIDIAMKRLGWTKKQGREYLMNTYNKTSRLYLDDIQLIGFRTYLNQLVEKLDPQDEVSNDCLLDSSSDSTKKDDPNKKLLSNWRRKKKRRK